MAHEQLTPAEFTFHSFRHSQGAVWPQMYIFRFFELNFNVKPDLHPSAIDRKRYLQFIGGTSLKAHIQYEETGALSADRKLFGSFKQLRDFTNSPPNIRHVNNFSDKTISGTLLRTTLKQEMVILNAEKSWAAKANGMESGRTERLHRRIESGKSSLVHYYGRDSHSTGIAEFDQMYADMWHVASRGDAGDTYTADLIEEHAWVVQTALRSHIHKTP